VLHDEIAGVNEHHEIRAATDIVCLIHLCISAPVIMTAQGSSKMAPGRKAEDTDALWINPPLLRIMPHDSKCSLGILQRSGVFLEALPLRNAVLQQQTGHPNRIHPL